MKYNLRQIKNELLYKFYNSQDAEYSLENFAHDKFLATISANEGFDFIIFDLLSLGELTPIQIKELVIVANRLRKIGNEFFIILNNKQKMQFMQKGVDALFSFFDSESDCKNFIEENCASEIPDQMEVARKVILKEVSSLLEILLRTKIDIVLPEDETITDSLGMECVQKIFFNCYQINIALYFDLATFENFFKAITQVDIGLITEKEQIDVVREFFNILRGRIKQNVKNNLNKSSSEPIFKKKYFDFSATKSKTVLVINASIGSILLEIY
ncbi:MAG: hypothetical protein HQK52_21850 [Oligoflexia bacterium]|nr:hypothetical protein [Oligoflexia bacterium]